MRDASRAGCAGCDGSGTSKDGKTVRGAACKKRYTHTCKGDQFALRTVTEQSRRGKTGNPEPVVSRPPSKTTEEAVGGAAELAPDWQTSCSLGPYIFGTATPD